eukprot:scaffold101256_cov72-Phaeocystis_antarctica.AAC.4
MYLSGFHLRGSGGGFAEHGLSHDGHVAHARVAVRNAGRVVSGGGGGKSAVGRSCGEASIPGHSEVGLVVEAEPALAIDCDHCVDRGVEGEFNTSRTSVLEVGLIVDSRVLQPEEARRRRHIGLALVAVVTCEVRSEAHHATQRA